jgi:hypothetical protein
LTGLHLPPLPGRQHNGLTRVSHGLATARDFDAAYRRFGSKTGNALTEQMFSGFAES